MLVLLSRALFALIVLTSAAFAGGPIPPPGPGNVTCGGNNVVTGYVAPNFICGAQLATGTVNSGTTNQIARYPSSTTTVGGSSTLTDDGTNVKFLGPGAVDLTTFSLATEIANEGTTGTSLNKLAKLTGAPSKAIITSAGDTTGAIGIVVGGNGTAGSAIITLSGQASCVFDGATTAGHYVAESPTVAGDCHDVATPPSGSPLMQVLSTNGGAGTYAVAIEGGSGGGSTGGTGSVTSVNTTVPGTLLTGTGCLITTNGTCAITLATQSANLLFAGPTSGGAVAPTFRALVAADVPTNLLPYSKLAQAAANTLLCNSTGSLGNLATCTLAARLQFSSGALDIVSGSIGPAQLAAGAAASNLGSAGGDLSGTYPSPNVAKVNSAAYPAAPAAHQVPVVTSAASGGTITYKTISDCLDSAGQHINYAQGTDTWSCGSTNNVSLTAKPGLVISPTPYVNGAGTIGPQWPINQTCKTINYTIAESDSATSLCMSGANLTLTVNSSAANYLPAGEAFTVTNLDATALTVSIGTGSSTFKNSPGSTTSFTLTTGAWAIIQSDSAGSPNNYWVFPSGAGGAAGGGAVVKISQQTTSGSSAFLQWTGLGSTYSNYLMKCYSLAPNTAADSPMVQYGTGAGPTWQSAGYQSVTVYADHQAGTIASVNNDGGAGIFLGPQVGTDATWGISFSATIYNIPSGTVKHHLSYNGVSNDSTNAKNQELNGGGGYGTAVTLTGLRFGFSTQTIAVGSCTLYGVTQ